MFSILVSPLVGIDALVFASRVLSLSKGHLSFIIESVYVDTCVRHYLSSWPWAGQMTFLEHFFLASLSARMFHMISYFSYFLECYSFYFLQAALRTWLDSHCVKQNQELSSSSVGINIRYDFCQDMRKCLSHIRLLFIKRSRSRNIGCLFQGVQGFWRSW